MGRYDDPYEDYDPCDFYPEPMPDFGEWKSLDEQEAREISEHGPVECDF